MTALPPAGKRAWLPWVTGLALLLVTGIALNRVLALREQLHEQVQDQLELQVRDRVASWEDQVLTQVEAWLQSATQDPGAAEKVQRQLRRQRPWFDSLYLWVPQKSLQIGSRRVVQEASFLFPGPPVNEERDSILSRPCLIRARQLTRDPDVSVVEVADAYQRWCASEDLPVRLVAATEAATLLNRANQPEAALAALDATGLEPDASLRQAIRKGISPFRVVIHRTQRAQIYHDLGRFDDALRLYYLTGVEVTELDAPQAQPLIQFVDWPILAQLDKHDQVEEAAHLRLLMNQAQRRVRAFREIAERIFPRSTPDAASAGTRFIYDQYSDPPFLLFYGVLDNDGPTGVALQLDQPLLLQNLLHSMKRLRKWIVITDANNEFVAGARHGGAVVMTVPFSRTLSHLRVGVREGVLDARLERLDDQWVVPLLVIVFALIVGAWSLTAQVRAARQQRLLLQRQRDFTTRVTHELKTPLAGIRLMAENLEAGAFRGEQQIGEMAGAIVHETDRLTQRVDEILSVATEREVPTKAPFDPEEVVTEAVMAWEPRMNRAGVALQADLEITDEVLGHRNSLRDAVSCLLDNALKYRDPGQETPSCQVRLYQQDRRVVVEVSDNGLGVPAAMRNEIFSRFVRVEGPNRGKSGGYGLGLAQVAEIARSHGGIVRCEASDTGGSRFVLELPAYRPPTSG